MQTYNVNKIYVDKYDQILVILSATAFASFLTENRLKDYRVDQLVFVRDIIILIKYTVDKELISQKNKV